MPVRHGAPILRSTRSQRRCPTGRCRLGAQDVYWEEHGPFTGAVSPLMLKECGVQVVQIGHSERREYFGETDATVNRKVIASLQHGFVHWSAWERRPMRRTGAYRLNAFGNRPRSLCMASSPLRSIGFGLPMSPPGRLGLEELQPIRNMQA